MIDNDAGSAAPKFEWHSTRCIINKWRGSPACTCNRLTKKINRMLNEALQRRSD